MNTRHIAFLGLIIALIALNSIPVTQVTAWDNSFTESTELDPLVPLYTHIPGNDNYVPVFISNYDENGKLLYPLNASLMFPTNYQINIIEDMANIKYSFWKLDGVKF